MSGTFSATTVIDRPIEDVFGLEGHGFGKLIVGAALRSARKGADELGRSIKAAIEAS